MAAPEPGTESYTYYVNGQKTATGSVTSGTFTSGEIVTQAVSGATAYVVGTVPAAGPMVVSSVSGSPDNNNTWTGGTSGAVFTPTGLPTFVSSHTAPYDTWAKASNTLSAVRTEINTNRAIGDTKCIYIAPGEYVSEYINGSITKYSNTTFTGAIGSSPRDASITVRDLVRIGSGSGSHVAALASPTDINIRNMTLVSGATKAGIAISTASTSNIVCQDIVIVAGASNSGTSVSIQSAVTGFTLTRSLIKTAENVSPLSTTAVDANGTISSCMFEPALAASYTAVISISTTGTLNFNNNTIVGSTAYAITHNGSGTVNINNCIINGGVSNAGYYTITRSAGTVNLSNSMILGPTAAGNKCISAGVNDLGGNVYEGNPKITKFNRPGFVILRVDDQGNFALASGLWAAALRSRGLKGTYYTTCYNWSSGDNTAARAMVAEGTVELGSHSWSHNSAALTTVGTLTYTGGTTKTYAIDLTNHVFTFTVDGASNNIDIYSDNSRTIASVITAIRAIDSNWNITYSNDGNGNTANGNMKVSSCSAVGTTNITTPIALDLTGYTSGYYKNEIVDSKAYLTDTVINGAGNVTDGQTGLTYVCNTMGNAYNIYNVDYSTAQRNAGLLAALCDSGYQFLKSFNLYKLTVSVTVANLIGVNDAATKERVKTLCWNAAQGGLVVTILGHTDTVATWTPILDALQEMQNEGIVTVTSAQLVAKTIRSSPWTYNAGTGISTRSYTSYHDFHIKPGSPCINTGVLASLPTKDAENKVWISTDMGAYAFRNTGFIRF